MANEANANGKRIRINGGFVTLVFVGVNLVVLLINLIASSGYTSKADFNTLRDQFRDYKETVASDLSHIRENQTTELGKIANGVTELNGKMNRNAEQDK